jgi:hypothetical protein
MLVDRVSYDVKWKKFRRGYSIFIPCLNCANAKLELLGTTNRLKIKVLTKVVIENGIRGLRIWRM